MTDHPTDHRARAAGRTPADLALDLAVEAGAGSGKTTVLVERFVNIACTPALGPERILAVTFTEKAAAEMKERIVHRFEQQGDAARRRATEAAYISTVHGFAGRLLREHPFAARVDPGFAVVTPDDQARFFAEALLELYAREELTTHAERVGQSFGGGWRLFEVVRDVERLVREGPETAAAELAAIEDDAAAVARMLECAKRREQRLLGLLREVADQLEQTSYTNTSGKFYQNVRQYVANCRECVATGAVVGTQLDWPTLHFTRIIAAEDKEIVGPVLHYIKPLLDTLKATSWDEQAALERELLPLKRAVYRATAQLRRRYDEFKAGLGALDFHDLQARAVAMLASEAGVRARYVERFRHILLDECQDTDDLQYRLISLLHDGNVLFMVGDPKQAIYEFRGANPGVFDGAIARLPAPSRLRLAENFRSRPEIMAFVNRIGPDLLADRFLALDARSTAYDGLPLAGAPVEMIYAVREEMEGGTEPTGDARAREAAAVAERVLELLRERPLVVDPATKARVPLAPRHVAVLFRTRTAVPYFERAFADRGIPYVTASGEGFYERAEVLDGMMLLRAVDQPHDDLALAAVLRSPFAGLTDAELWRLGAARRATRGGSLHRALAAAPAHAAWYERFAALRRRARGAAAHAVLADGLATFDYEAALAAHPDGRAMLANVAKLRRTVEGFGPVPVARAVRQLRQARELLDRESQAALQGEGDDVVVFSTVHQAKGLEWPLVCLANIAGRGNTKTPAFSPRHGLLLLPARQTAEDGAVTDATPLSQVEAVEEIRQRSEAEERRLLYVALTRARERLLLSGTVKAADLDAAKASRTFNPFTFLRATLGDAVLARTQDAAHDGAGFSVRVAHVEAGPMPVGTYEAGAPLLHELAPVGRTAPPAEPSRAVSARPLSLKVTELLAYRRCPQVHRFAYDLAIAEHLADRAEARGAAKTWSAVDVGTRVHTLLERADFAAPLDPEIARLVAGEPEALRERLATMLRAVLGGEIGALVRGARRVLREWPFVTRVGGVLVEGVVDLALETDEGWIVFDYKSNDLSRLDRRDYLVKHYTPQLQLYALALERAGLGPVRECALVFLYGPVVHRWAVGAATLAAAEQEAAGLVGRIAGRDYATTAGDKCRACGYRRRRICDVGCGRAPVLVTEIGSVPMAQPIP